MQNIVHYTYAAHYLLLSSLSKWILGFIYFRIISSLSAPPAAHNVDQALFWVAPRTLSRQMSQNVTDILVHEKRYEEGCRCHFFKDGFC